MKTSNFITNCYYSTYNGTVVKKCIFEIFLSKNRIEHTNATAQALRNIYLTDLNI
jgi:hypothetical protein